MLADTKQNPRLVVPDRLEQPDQVTFGRCLVSALNGQCTALKVGDIKGGACLGDALAMLIQSISKFCTLLNQGLRVRVRVRLADIDWRFCARNPLFESFT